MSDDQNQLDWLEKDLDRNLDWIKAADTRIFLVVPLSTGMLGALSLTRKLSPNVFSLDIALILISGALLGGSIVCIAAAAFPRTVGPKGSLIFFGGIASRSLSEFQQAINERDVTSRQQDLINQCHRNAEIASLKYKWVRRSLAFLLIGSISWAFTMYLSVGG
jgi:hypothetical protein